MKRGRIAKGSVLIIENLDRLSRADVDIAHDLFRDIIRAGVWICTRIPFRIYKGESTDSFLDLLEPIWIMYVSWMESVKKSKRVAGAWKEAREKAREERLPHQGAPPWWIRRVGDHYEFDPVGEPLMRRICNLTLEGYGCTEITELLLKEGVPPVSRTGRWSPTSVRYDLRSRKLVGEYQPHQIREGGKRVPVGPPIPGYYPALLSEDEWPRVQASINARHRTCGGRPPRTRCNLFTGIIFDAATRRPLAAKPSGHSKSGAGYHRYLKVSGRGGGQTQLRYDEAEEAILNTLAVLRPEDVQDPAARSDEREQRIADLTGRLVALEERSAEISRAIEDPGNAAAVAALAKSLSSVQSELAAVAKERDALKLECLSSRAEVLVEAQTLAEHRKTVTGAERKELDRRIKAALPSVVSEIWVQCQRLSERRQIVHIQIFLRGGECRHVRLPPRHLYGAESWDLEGLGWDLRRGPYRPGKEVGHAARRPKPA